MFRGNGDRTTLLGMNHQTPFGALLQLARPGSAIALDPAAVAAPGLATLTLRGYYILNRGRGGKKRPPPLHIGPLAPEWTQQDRCSSSRMTTHAQTGLNVWLEPMPRGSTADAFECVPVRRADGRVQQLQVVKAAAMNKLRTG